MQSGPYAKKGTVVETGTQDITSWGFGPRLNQWYVEVEFPHGDGGRFFIRFDAKGKTGSAYEGLGYWEWIGPEIGKLQSDPRTPGTEYGPWELVETPTENKAKERDPKKFSLFDFCKVW